MQACLVLASVSEVGHLCRGCGGPEPGGEVLGGGVLPALCSSASVIPFFAFCGDCISLSAVIQGIASYALVRPKEMTLRA